ncbi:MAG: hypothetical protein II260_02850 [Muribaculaceae bacterium]|nr:hypothetical protein [Muribaculaceae bacterium]
MSNLEDFLTGGKRAITPKYYIPKDDDCENQLLENTKFAKWGMLAIGALLFGIALSIKNDILIAISIAMIVVVVINFAILIPLFKVLVNISRNLKELIKKKD